MTNNLRFYDVAREVPAEAKREIKAGRLKGKTDINPMYRIKRLTELFGPCGLGWWYVIRDERIVDDEITKQCAAFVDIDLFYKDPESGEISQPIPGTGGARFVSRETNGPFLSDECFKMALTDAISVSAKAIGVAADVYWDKDRTKYTRDVSPAPNPAPRGTTEAAQAAGREKLDRINAQMPNAMQSTSEPITGPQPASEGQKRVIREKATDEEYLRIMQKYGAELERLSMSGAVKVIREIEKRIAEAS